MSQSINMRNTRSVFARQQRGFTLIELIVATAILAILVGAMSLGICIIIAAAIH